jgi:DNA-binding transcriptional LysR family regulator
LIDLSNECILYFSSNIVMRDFAMIPNLDVDQLKTFLAIADVGNFTRAAEEVNKTQSAVSMQMRRLEDILGRPLFARDGRGSRFTNDGERLIEHARRIVALNDEAVSAFTKPEITGTVRFGTPDDYADLFLPEVLARFNRTHPLVTVDVECFSTLILTERIKRGELDLSLATFDGGDIDGETIRSTELVWATSTRHSIHLVDQVPIATSQIGCCWRRMALDALESVGRKYRIAYSSPNSSTLNAAVLQGLAIAAMPEICLRPGMRVLGAADGFPKIGVFDIGLISKPGKQSSAVEALARHVREGLGSPRLMVAAE